MGRQMNRAAPGHERGRRVSLRFSISSIVLGACALLFSLLSIAGGAVPSFTVIAGMLLFVSMLAGGIATFPQDRTWKPIIAGLAVDVLVIVVAAPRAASLAALLGGWMTALLLVSMLGIVGSLATLLVCGVSPSIKRRHAAATKWCLRTLGFSIIGCLLGLLFLVITSRA